MVFLAISTDNANSCKLSQFLIANLETFHS